MKWFESGSVGLAAGSWSSPGVWCRFGVEAEVVVWHRAALGCQVSLWWIVTDGGVSTKTPVLDSGVQQGGGLCSVSESLTTLCHLNPLSAELENLCVCMSVCVFVVVLGTHVSYLRNKSAFWRQHLQYKMEDWVFTVCRYCICCILHPQLTQIKPSDAIELEQSRIKYTYHW